MESGKRLSVESSPKQPKKNLIIKSQEQTHWKNETGSPKEFEAPICVQSEKVSAVKRSLEQPLISPKKQKISDSKNVGINSSIECPNYVKQIAHGKIDGSYGWLTFNDIAIIAKTYYGWNEENDNVMFKLVDKNFFESQEHRSFMRGKMNELLNSKKKALILIVHKKTYHYIPSIIVHHNGKCIVHFINSYCLKQKEKNHRRTFFSKWIENIGKINPDTSLTYRYYKCEIDVDHSCGIFALEYAKQIINAIQNSESTTAVEHNLKLCYRETLEQILKKQDDFANALISSYYDKLRTAVNDVDGFLLVISNICADILADVMDVNESCLGNVKPLQLAVRTGRLDLVTTLLDRGADVDAECDINKASDAEIIKRIVERTANINKGYIFKQQPKFTSEDVPYRESINFDTGHILIALWGTNNTFQSTRSPLEMAVHHGYFDIAMVLINRGAKFNGQECGKKTMRLLLSVIIENRWDIMKTFIDSSVDIIERSENLLISLISSIKVGNVEIINALIDMGANVNAVIPSCLICFKKSSCGCDFQHERNYWLTPLLLAVKFGRLNVIMALVNRGANVNGKSKEKRLTMIEAYSAESYYSFINNRSKDYCTITIPLFQAIYNGRLDIINFLIDRGANVNEIIHSEGEWTTALGRAIKVGSDLEIVNTLIHRGASVEGGGADYWMADSPLFLAIKADRLDIVSALIEKGANINLRCKKRTALSEAVSKGSIEIAKRLVDAGATVIDIRAVLLERFVSKNCVEMVQFLIHIGAYAGNMSSPMKEAVSKNYFSIVEVLIDQVAEFDPNIEHALGTLLGIAASKGHLKTVQTLIKKGADVTVKPKSKSDALTQAIVNRRMDVILHLVNHVAKLKAAGLPISIPNSRILKGMHTRLRDVLDVAGNFHKYFSLCENEIEKLQRENCFLYDFLKTTDIQTLTYLWEANTNRFVDEDVRDRYPEYADILINKANKIRKHIFLHNHKPLINVLSDFYKNNLEKMEFSAIFFFFKTRRTIVTNFATVELLLIDFVDFSVKKKYVPRLEVFALAQNIMNGPKLFNSHPCFK